MWYKGGGGGGGGWSQKRNYVIHMLLMTFVLMKMLAARRLNGGPTEHTATILPMNCPYITVHLLSGSYVILYTGLETKLVPKDLYSTTGHKFRSSVSLDLL